MSGGARYLVTGGAGFIGSHLCDRLIGAGHRVICLDNGLTGREQNIRHLLSRPDFDWLKQDVTAPFDVPVDAIYHLACPASPLQYQRDPVATTRTAVLGTLNALELARTRQVPVLIASTSEIYGDPAVNPQPEAYWGHVNPIGPRACYDEGKRCAETLTFDYHRQYGVAVKVVRIFNTYGPRIHLDDGRVVSNFIRQALTGAPITLFGAGAQTRSFCYVDDLVEGLIRMMATPPACTGPVNLGNPEEVSIRALAEHIRHCTGSRAPLVNDPLPQDDPQRRKPDITLAQRLLNWAPTVPLAEGLPVTIADLREQLCPNHSDSVC